MSKGVEMDTLNYLKTRYGFSIDGQNPIILNHFSRKGKIIELFNELNFRRGVEVGTDTGRYAKDLCEGLANLKLTTIDPFLPYTEGDEIKDEQRSEAIYLEAVERLKNFNCEVVRKTSMEAIKDFEDNSLDFVFIDGNHEYEYVLEDITEWSRKVKVGGIVYGHDYTENKNRKYGVIEAVNKYVSDNNINPWFVLHTPSHNKPIKRGNFVDCWLFIKK